MNSDRLIPEALKVDLGGDALKLSQAGEESDLGGQDGVVGDLEQKLLPWVEEPQQHSLSGRLL